MKAVKKRLPRPGSVREIDEKVCDKEEAAPKKPAAKRLPRRRSPSRGAKPKAAAKPAKPALAKSTSKTIVLYPEAAFGPALNCVGIAQQLKSMGHNPVFVCDRGFKGVFEKYGFEENLVDMSGGMSDEEMAKFWVNFIAGHLPHFRLSPIEQLPTYVIPVWEAIVDCAIISHEGLTEHLAIKPDVVCVDNVILFRPSRRRQALDPHHLLLGERDPDPESRRISPAAATGTRPATRPSRIAS